jgi:tetratricopeptide (TPR) repeat protein
MSAIELFAGSEAAKNDPAGAYFRLGVALKEQGLPAESGACYRQALDRRPDYVEALNNLGVLLQEQNDFVAAADHLEKARRIQPETAQFHFNLGVVLLELSRPDEARMCFEQALALKPGYVEAHYNLGVVLVDLNRPKEARHCFEQALALGPDYIKAESQYSLGMLARDEGDRETAAACFRQVVQLRADDPRAQTELAILSWMRGDFADCVALLKQIAQSRAQLSDKEKKFVGSFREFLEKLLAYRQANSDHYRDLAGLPVLYTVGDSNSLAPAHLQVVLWGTTYRVAAKVVIGAKAWHLGRSQANRFKMAFEKIAATIPPGATVLALFGEIDCRLDEGIKEHHRKTGNDLSLAIPELVENYVACLDRVAKVGSLNLLVANVPAPIIYNAAVSEEDRRHQAYIVQEFNRAMKASCVKRNFPILDLYGATVGPDGLAHGQGHLDMFHLKPLLYKELVEKL